MFMKIQSAVGYFLILLWDVNVYFQKSTGVKKKEFNLTAF